MTGTQFGKTINIVVLLLFCGYALKAISDAFEVSNGTIVIEVVVLFGIVIAIAIALKNRKR